VYHGWRWDSKSNGGGWRLFQCHWDVVCFQRRSLDITDRQRYRASTALRQRLRHVIIHCTTTNQPRLGVGTLHTANTAHATCAVSHFMMQIKAKVAEVYVKFDIYLYTIRFIQQESRAAARKRRDAEAILFRLKFANIIHNKVWPALMKQGFGAPNILAHCVWCGLVQP